MKTTIQCESLSFQRVLRFKKKKTKFNRCKYISDIRMCEIARENKTIEQMCLSFENENEE